jgi:hypothetical protein
MKNPLSRWVFDFNNEKIAFMLGLLLDVVVGDL